MFDFEPRYKAYFNVKSERLITQLVKLIESMAKEKALRRKSRTLCNRYSSLARTSTLPPYVYSLTADDW